MIVDFHTHIFPSHIRENREKYFRGEPEFKLLYDAPKSRLAGIRELIKVMDEQNVELSVVVGFPWKNPTTLKKHNDYIAEAIERFAGRVVGFCCLDPFSEDAVPETERCLSGNFSGVGELAFYKSGIDEISVKRMEPIMEICRQADVPVLIHTNNPIGHEYPGKAPMTFIQLYELIKKFHENKIVLAHWGGGLFFFNLAKKAVRQYFKHIYFDTAASPFIYNPMVYNIAVQILGPEKILFGSDYPLIQPSRYLEEMEKAGLTSFAMRRILGQNAAGLLKI